MANVKGITIKLGLSDRSVMKLRAIAKHAEALADELDAIDNAWQCQDCGASEYYDMFDSNKFLYRTCEECKHTFSAESIEQPTQLKGNE